MAHLGKAVVLEQFGNPADVLRATQVPVSAPAAGQVRVRMLASPINPSDLLLVRGQYGYLPRLPATPGFEGAGVVEAVGRGLIAKLRGLRPGRRVAVLNARGGNWQEQVIVSAREVVPVREDLPVEQLASFFVNPATALVMTRSVLCVPPGAWLLQTAAGSALGRMIIRLAKHAGFRTINVVRRSEQVEELKNLGGDEVIATDTQNLEERVKQITGDQGVRYALDAVGGSTGLGAVRALSKGGRLLLYGTLSGEPIPIQPRDIMIGQKSVQGFWLSEWARQQSIWTMLRLFRNIERHLRAGILSSAVQESFPLERIQDAVRAAEAPARTGKILLRMNAD